MPVGSPPFCAFAGKAPSNTVKIATKKPNRQAMEFSPENGPA
jgi:hypothetical protein